MGLYDFLPILNVLEKSEPLELTGFQTKDLVLCFSCKVISCVKMYRTEVEPMSPEPTSYPHGLFYDVIHLKGERFVRTYNQNIIPKMAMRLAEELIY